MDKLEPESAANEPRSLRGLLRRIVTHPDPPVPPSTAGTFAGAIAIATLLLTTSLFAVMWAADPPDSIESGNWMVVPITLVVAALNLLVIRSPTLPRILVIGYLTGLCSLFTIPMLAIPSYVVAAVAAIVRVARERWPARRRSN